MTDQLDLLAWRPPPEPMPPHQRHSATSRAAAASVRGEAARLRGVVLAHIRDQGATGCTDEEGDDVLGLGPNTYRPRRVELVQRGEVRDSGTKRATRSGRDATVWIAA